MSLPSSQVILELSVTPTAAGYNDGLHATETSEEGTTPTLSLQGARASGVSKVSSGITRLNSK